MLHHMKIGWRLAPRFCIVIVFAIAVIIVSLNQMAAGHDKLEMIVK